jgi:hypothetical protein
MCETPCSAFVARWSSAGQKHHAFIGFKDSATVTRALSVQIPRAPNRDWRVSRLNPDLKMRVVELLPKFTQAKIKAEEKSANRQGPAGSPEASSAAAGPASTNGAWASSQSHGTETGWQYPGGAPPGWEGSGASGYRSSPPNAYDIGPDPYAGGNAPTSWVEPFPSTDVSNLSFSAPIDNPMLDGAARPSSHRPEYVDVMPSYRTAPRSPSPTRWNNDTHRPLSPRSLTSFRSLPAKPATFAPDPRASNSRFPPRGPASLDARDRARDNDRYNLQRRSPPPPRAAPRRYSPPRSVERDSRNLQRRDSRQDDRDRDGWVRNTRDRGARSRSRTPDRGRSRSPARSARDPRAPPPGRDPRANDFRKPREPGSRAMSPGQLSSNEMDKASSTHGQNAILSSRRSQSPSLMDPEVLTVSLSKENAPVSSWMEVASRYRRLNQLDIADRVMIVSLTCHMRVCSRLMHRSPMRQLSVSSQAPHWYALVTCCVCSVDFKQLQPPAPDSAKPFHLVLANTHNARARQLPPNSEEANMWQSRASEWIRQAQALGVNGDENLSHDATDGLLWLQKHMLDKSIPRDVGSPVSHLPPQEFSLGCITNAAPSSSQRPASEGDTHVGARSNGASADYLARIDELQTKHQYALSQLKAEQGTRKRLEDRVKSLEGLLRAAEARLVAVETRGHQAGGGEGGGGNEPELLQLAEAEKVRLLQIISEERYAKRKAEDAEQEERRVRRALEDKLWQLGASIDPPTV